MKEAVRDCERVLADVSAYLDGDLDAGACRQMKRHCRTCGRCRTLVSDLERTVRLCRKAGDRPLPARVRQRARAEVARLLARVDR